MGIEAGLQIVHTPPSKDPEKLRLELIKDMSWLHLLIRCVAAGDLSVIKARDELEASIEERSFIYSAMLKDGQE